MPVYQKLISDDAERRVYSIEFSDTPDPELVSVFSLGVQFGYFQRSTVANKDGTARTTMYRLTRRLAPYFNLDPTAFSACLFVTSTRVRDAIADPEGFLRRVKKEGVEKYFEEQQLEMAFETFGVANQ